MKNLNDEQERIANKPFEADDEVPYIFISYKHNDWRRVYPIIGRLHDAGFNIWYDEGLPRGKNYDIEIVRHIKKSKLFITFITEEVIKYANDSEDYVVKELSVAKNEKMDRLPIFLDNINLDGPYAMHYLDMQSIYRHHYGDNESMFIAECVRVLRDDFEMKQNEKDSLPDAEAEQVSMPKSPKQVELEDIVNSLEEFENPPDIIVDKLTDMIYGRYEDNAREYLADAYGMALNETNLDNEVLHDKYGPQADSFKDRLANLKLELPNFRKEAINRIKCLNSIGYEIADNDDDGNEKRRFSDAEKIELAKYNHYLWCKRNLEENREYGFEGLSDRYMAGVVLEGVQSDLKIIAPYRDSLVLWDDLSNYEQKGNIDFVDKIFEYLPSDLKIVKIRIKRSKEYLNGLISGGEKSIVLDSDIKFDTDAGGDIKIFGDDLTIDGDGHIIDADKKSRIFTIRGKNITFKNLTFKNGCTSHNGGAVSIRQKGECSFINCSFTNNVSSEGMWGVDSEGGAIYNEGICLLDSCEFKGNRSSRPNSKDLAPFGSFQQKNCIFDGKSYDSHDEVEVLGDKYSFRDPESEIYSIAEKIYPFLSGSDEDFSKLSDEKYFSYERHAIRAMCVAKAAGGRISQTPCPQQLDISEVDNWKTFQEAQKLFIPIMNSFGWKNGPYDYDNKTILLTSLGGGLTDDKEEQFIHRMVESVKKAGLYFCSDESVGEKALPDSNDAEPSKIQTLPPKSYGGDEAYIYVSYAHRDAGCVFPDIENFQREGYNIWYDDGLATGTEWDDEIANAILGCSLFVVFISNNSVESSNVRDEIFLALGENIPILPIYIEETELKHGLRLRLAHIQAIFKYDVPEEKYVELCIHTFNRFGLEAKAGGDESADQNDVILPKSYVGSEPYVYVCYKHSDSKMAFPLIKQLSDAGYNVCHDDGGLKGANFEVEIANRIVNSALFVSLITKNMMESAMDADDYCIKELGLAYSKNIPCLPIYLEDVALEGYYMMRYAGSQAIFKFKQTNVEFIKSVDDAFKGLGLEIKSDSQKSELKGLRNRLFGRK